MSNPVLEVSRGEVDAIEAASKKLSKPLWVIAIATSVASLLLLLVVGYGALQYLSLMNALSDVGTPDGISDTSEEGQNGQSFDPEDYER